MKTLEKLLSFRNLLFILPIIVCFSCKKPLSEEGVTNLYFTNVESEIILGVGDEFQINYAVEPSEAFFTAVIEWNSSDEGVATVEFGKITAKGLGTATITAKCGELTQQAVVRINGYSATSFTIPTEFNVFKDHKVRFPVSDIVPSQAKVSAIMWKLEDPSMASIEVSDDYVFITGSKIGTTKLIAQSKDLVKECSIKINEYIPVTAISLTLSKTVASMNGEKIDYTISYTPANACVDKDYNLVFSSDAMVAEMEKGDLQGSFRTAQIKGNLSVYAEYGDGIKSNTVNVNIYKPVQYFGIETVNTSYNLMSPDGSYGYPTSKKLVLKLTPTDANPPVTYTSSNPSAVKVSADGTLTAVGHGVSEIKVQTRERHSATIIIRSIKKSSITYHYARYKDGSTLATWNEKRITTGKDETVFGDNEQLGYQDRYFSYWDPASYYKNSVGEYIWDSNFYPRNTSGTALTPTISSSNSDYTVSVSWSRFNVMQQSPKLHKTNSIIKLYPPQSTTAALTLDMSYGASNINIGLAKNIDESMSTSFLWEYKNNIWSPNLQNGANIPILYVKSQYDKYRIKVVVKASKDGESLPLEYWNSKFVSSRIVIACHSTSYPHIKSVSTGYYYVDYYAYFNAHKDSFNNNNCYKPEANVFYLVDKKSGNDLVNLNFYFSYDSNY